MPDATNLIKTPPRRYAIGAEPISDRLASVRVWAPDHTHVAVVVDGEATALERDADGYFSAVVNGRTRRRIPTRPLDISPTGRTGCPSSSIHPAMSGATPAGRVCE